MRAGTLVPYARIVAVYRRVFARIARRAGSDYGSATRRAILRVVSLHGDRQDYVVPDHLPDPEEVVACRVCDARKPRKHMLRVRPTIPGWPPSHFCDRGCLAAMS